MALPVNLTPQSLNPGVCYANEQQRLNDFVQHIAAQLGINFTPTLLQATAPGPDDRDKIWVQVDGSNAIQDVLTFSNGGWNGLPKPFVLGHVEHYDPQLYTPAAPWYPCDGSVSLVNAQGVGVPDLRGRTLICAGQRVASPAMTVTLPDGTVVVQQDPSTNFTAGNIGGTESVFLTQDQNGAHWHTTGATGAQFVVKQVGFGGELSGSGEHFQVPNTSMSGLSSGHNNLGPYYVFPIMQWRPDLAAL